jgi:hypothetical protein
MAEVEPITHLQQLIHRTDRGLTLHGSGPCLGGDHALRWSRELYGTRRSTVIGDLLSGLCLLAEHLRNQIHRVGDGTLVGAQHLIGCLSQGLAAFRLLQQHADMLA